jgi:hypothetical protein
MADEKTVVHEEQHETTASGDPIYSIAESVRKVADEETSDETRVQVKEPEVEQEAESTTKPAKISKPKKAAPKKKTTTAKAESKPKKAAAKSKADHAEAVKEISAELHAKKESETMVTLDAKPESSEDADSDSESEEVFEFNQATLWKATTVIFALLVIWSYFFRGM